MFGFLLLLCMCIHCRFLVCSYHEVLIQWYGIYIYSGMVCVCVCILKHKVVLNCWSLNFKCISNILHVYSPHDCWFWYHICVWMISYLYYTFIFPFIIFLFLVVAFSFLLREAPKAGLMNSPRFCLSIKLLIYPSNLNECLPGWLFLVIGCFFLSQH